MEVPESITGELKLSDLRKGDFGEVVHNDANGYIRRRLLDMGIVKGVKFTIVRKAPLGDPIELKINGFLLSLRIEEAKLVQVRLIDKK
jgi:ferrous iron transport protein A